MNLVQIKFIALMILSICKVQTTNLYKYDIEPEKLVKYETYSTLPFRLCFEIRPNYTYHLQSASS